MSNVQTSKRAGQVIEIAFLAIALYFIAAYVVLAVLRLRYPFELEWMEGGMVDHVLRLLAGQRIYAPPSFDCVPYGYPPLYYYLSALLARITGPGFVPLRLVSLISSLGSLFLVFRIAWRETGSKYCGVVGAALFAATFKLSEGWLDIAKVDSLFLCLLLLGIYLLRFHDSRPGYFLAGIVLALSFFTKQTALAAALPLLLGMAVLKKRRGLIPLLTMLSLAAAGTLLLNWLHHGWYNYYVFHLPKLRLAANFDPGRIIGFWTTDILAPFLPAVLFAAVFFLLGAAAGKSRGTFFYLLAVAGMVGGAWVSRLETGAFHNVLLPAYAIMAILFGLGLARLREFLAARDWGRRPGSQALLHALAAAQFVLLLYDPRSLLPTPADLQAGRELIAIMSRLNGEVLLFDDGFLPTLAGKKTHAQACAVNDIFRADHGPVGLKLRAEIQKDLREKRFSFVILQHPHWFAKYLGDSYKILRPVFSQKKVFWPVTGKRRKNRFIYVPR